MDNEGLISYRLYRQHITKKSDGGYYKDLGLLGRDLAKCLLVDDKASNFENLPENGIEIESWEGDKSDVALFELATVLLDIVQHPSHDLRIALDELDED